MIGFLSGKLEKKFLDSCILMVNNVGYLVTLPLSTMQIISEGDNINIFIHTVVRDDAILLYGFLLEEEYELFQLLITVNGIGPKVAQGILSAITVELFYGFVKNKNLSEITKLPGIGKKTAERIVLELSDKIEKISINNEYKNNNYVSNVSNNLQLSREALISLGYSITDVNNALSKVYSQSNSQDIIREALRILSKF